MSSARRPDRAASDGPVLLDWSFIGDGALGEDIGNPVIDAFTEGHIDVARQPELIEAAVEGYAAGFGIGADPRTIRRAVAASAAAKYAWFGPSAVDRFARDGAAESSFYDTDGSAEERFERWRPMCEQLVAFAEEVLDT